MATIAFLIEHEEGHLNPTFRLARRLAVRGHRVVYLGLADGGDFVRAQGFDFVPILQDVFPRGTVRTLREMMRTAPSTAGEERSAEIGASLQAVADMPYARTWKGLLDAGPQLDRTVEELRPDLFVLTSLFVPHALVLRSRFRLPAVLLTPLLRTVPKSEYAAAVVRLMKELGETKERVGALLAGPAPQRAMGLAQRLLVHVLRMRELILRPSDFELPGRSWEQEPEVFYVEPTVDLERRPEGAFPWEALDPARRLLYVSLGSQSHRAGHERVAAFPAGRGRGVRRPARLAGGALDRRAAGAGGDSRSARRDRHRLGPAARPPRPGVRDGDPWRPRHGQGVHCARRPHGCLPDRS
jgi:UDP:flavonoid glycosyltransferase YjiC (YdhE family)